MNASPQPTVDDPRAAILAAPMSLYQSFAVAITTALCALDGFNVFSVTLAAPGIVHEWGIGKGALGVVFSMSLVGMAAGSLVLSPLADLYGRRRIILASLALMILGMLASAFVHTTTTLAVFRMLTGLGVGAMISVIFPLAAEYSSAKRRDLAVIITSVGYGLGGALGGMAIAALLHHFDWRSIFFLGAGLSLLMTPVVYFWLPESVPYLVNHPSPKSLERINRFLAGCRLAPVTQLPAATAAQAQRPQLSEIFKPGMLALTLQMTLTNLLFVLTVYYMFSWIPQIVADLGFSASQAAKVTVTFNMGGIVGSLALGWASHRLGLKPLVLAGLFGLAVMTTLFGFAPANLSLITLIAAAAGICQFGAMAGVYAVMTRTFAARTRATGTGFVVGIGRVSSALAPAIAGFMMASGLSRGQVSMAMALPTVAAAIVLIIMPVRNISADV